MPIPSLRPEPKRDHYGRYLIDGQAYTRATTVVGTLKDLNGLMNWKRRKVAEGLAVAPQLLRAIPDMAAEIEAAGDDWRSAKEAKARLDALCDQAADAAGANRGSKAGTEAHTLSEWADAGRLDEVKHLATEAELADLQAYLDAMDRNGIERPVEYIERIVINSTVESAGTFDRLVRLRDGRLVVADLKSQQSVDFGFLEIACQLAQYANADAMLSEAGDLVPLPDDLDLEVGLVMHAPVGSARCDLYLVDLVTGWEAAQVAHRVRQLRKASKALGRPFTSPPPSPEDTRRHLHLVRNAPHVESLKGLWRDLKGQGLWTDELTRAAAARRAELEAAA